MSGNSNSNINFEYWLLLASTNPQKFEQLRKDKISAAIENATGFQRQRRLRGLQWRIDIIREQHKDSAMAACLAISNLMWETFEQLAELLQAQAKNGLTPVPVKIHKFKANIIPFPLKP